MLGRREGDKVICETHTAGAWQEREGDRYIDRDGKPWTITRFVPVVPTRLVTGGVAPCWEVRGVPAEPTTYDLVRQHMVALGRWEAIYIPDAKLEHGLKLIAEASRSTGYDADELCKSLKTLFRSTTLTTAEQWPEQ